MLLHETIEFDVAHPVSPYRYVPPLFNSKKIWLLEMYHFTEN